MQGKRKARGKWRERVCGREAESSERKTEKKKIDGKKEQVVLRRRR